MNSCALIRTFLAVMFITLVVFVTSVILGGGYAVLNWPYIWKLGAALMLGLIAFEVFDIVEHRGKVK